MSWEIAIALSVSSLVFIFIILAYMARDTLPMQFLFLIMSFGMSLLSLGIARQFAVLNSATQVVTLIEDAIIGMGVVYLVFFVYFLVEFFKSWFQQKKDEKFAGPFRG